MTADALSFKCIDTQLYKPLGFFLKILICQK